MYDAGFIHRDFHAVNAKEWERLKAKPTLEETEYDKADDWIVIYKEGTGQKYGRTMYSKTLDQTRHQTMGEFYGTSTVD